MNSMTVARLQGAWSQLDLFDPVSARPEINGEGGTRSVAFEEPQAVTAFAKQRALTTGDLMERIVSSANLQEAYKRVKANKGASGVDGMTITELKTWLSHHREALIASLLDGSYTPSPILGIEIPKPGGGVRQLGIPTVLDRLVQQAILQVLQAILDPSFSASSFGFRPGRGAHEALLQAQAYVAEGYKVVVDLDLEKFFDTVNHDILMSRLARRIGDKRLLKLIRRFLAAGMMSGGLDVKRYQGTPQGGPLSPLLANLLLDDLDKELEKRGHRFCRYADDCNIYVGSQQAGERVMASITSFLEGKLKLRINRAKSAVALCHERSFLGYRLLSGGRLSIAAKSLERVKAKLKQITRRNRGIPLERMIAEVNAFAQGWVTYFRLAQCRGHLQSLDEWLRRRLRCFRLKQTKRIIPRVKFLMAQGVCKGRAWLAASSKGWWRLADCPPVKEAMPNAWFEDQGFKPLKQVYLSLQTLENRRGT